MFRLVDRPLSFRHRIKEWVYKMLFLWSREPAPSPRASPWFAWLTTAVILWGFRHRIIKAIRAMSPLRLLKGLDITSRSSPTTKTTVSMASATNDRQISLILHPKHATGIRTKVKRLCTGDGPHVSNSSKVGQTTQQIDYRTTRSGRVYGKYNNKVAVST